MQYWLDYWQNVYTWLIEKYSSKVFFLDYDQLCLEPGKCLDILSELLLLDKDLLAKEGGRIRSAVRHGAQDEAPHVSASQKTLYTKLKKLSIA